MKVNVAVLLLCIFVVAYQECLPNFNKVTDKLLKHATRGTLTQQRWEKIWTTSNSNEWEIVLRYLPDLLQAAIKAGQLTATQILLANCLYYSVDFSHNQLLKLAACQGNSDIVLHLLRRFSYTQQDLNNALISACIEDYSENAEILLMHGADSNTKISRYASLLSVVACKGYASMMEVLLNHGADPKANNDRLLFQLSEEGALKELELLTQWVKKPTSVPFSFGALETNISHIEELIALHGCVPFKRWKYQKVVSILQACQEICQQRFRQEINLQFIEQTTTDTFTIEKLRSFIEEQHADVHAFDDYALRHAVQQGNVRAVSVLLCINLIPTIEPFNTELLRELLEFCNTQIALRTIQRNVYIQITEKLAFYQNQQKFIEAIQHGTITTAQELQKLIDEGADVHWNKEWALRWSIIQDNNHLISLLKRHRPDLTVNDNEPFHLAITHGHQNLVPLLLNPAIAKIELEKAIYTNNITLLDRLITWARDLVPFPFEVEFIRALRICAHELDKQDITDRLHQLENYLLSTEMEEVSGTGNIHTQTRITEETPLHPTASIEQELAACSEFVEIPLVIER